MKHAAMVFIALSNTGKIADPLVKKKKYFLYLHLNAFERGVGIIRIILKN